MLRARVERFIADGGRGPYPTWSSCPRWVRIRLLLNLFAERSRYETHDMVGGDSAALAVVAGQAIAQASHENSQQQKMTTCNADAKAKGLKAPTARPS